MLSEESPIKICFRVVANRFPTYFVTGNHDYYYGNVAEWLDLYREKNIKVLMNKLELNIFSSKPNIFSAHLW